MVKSYAGIGARKTPLEVLKVMRQTAYLLAKNGVACRTGAAKGADQTFADGAALAGGEIFLSLPWDSYEKDWVRALPVNVVSHVLDITSDLDAVQSVYDFHPEPKKLSQGVFKLHARNYLIVQNSSFVICWTPGGLTTGGTGQGIRIAKRSGIPIYNLGNPKVLLDFKKDIQNRITELPPNLQ